MAESDFVHENALLKAAIRAVPLLVRLGNHEGNGDVDPANPESLGERCDVLLALKNAIDAELRAEERLDARMPTTPKSTAATLRDQFRKVAKLEHKLGEANRELSELRARVGESSKRVCEYLERVTVQSRRLKGLYDKLDSEKAMRRSYARLVMAVKRAQGGPDIPVEPGFTLDAATYGPLLWELRTAMRLVSEAEAKAKTAEEARRPEAQGQRGERAEKSERGEGKGER